MDTGSRVAGHGSRKERRMFHFNQSFNLAPRQVAIYEAEGQVTVINFTQWPPYCHTKQSTKEPSHGCKTTREPRPNAQG